MKLLDSLDVVNELIIETEETIKNQKYAEDIKHSQHLLSGLYQVNKRLLEKKIKDIEKEIEDESKKTN